MRRMMRHKEVFSEGKQEVKGRDEGQDGERKGEKGISRTGSRGGKRSKMVEKEQKEKRRITETRRARGTYVVYTALSGW